MYKHTLFIKFILAYLIFGILGFLLIATVGSQMVEKRLEFSIGEDLYREATAISEDSLVQSNTSASNLLSLKHYLEALSEYQTSDIWILNKQGQRVLSTEEGFSYYDPITIDGFDPTKWGSYYRTGNFYGFFDEDRLSVLAPITDGSTLTIRGYVAMHYPMSELYYQRELFLSISYILFLLLFLLSLSILLLFRKIVYTPLKKITEGTNEFAAGHLDYQIPISSNDEMGALAASLNYMSDVLNQSGEYQRNFIANISHDFRSPLTSIKGYVEAMTDGTIPPELHEKYLKIILFETERLTDLTQDLLTLNEFDTNHLLLNREVFDIHEMIKHVAASFEGVCTQKKISIELVFATKHLNVNADKRKIQQVLYNLLDNAIKFSDPDSIVTIETTDRGEKVYTSVKDNGMGIPRSALGKIWERFYKSDLSRGKDKKGTGLGLAIVKEAIQAHGENITVVSTEGVGTEFSFSLPKVAG